MNKAVGQRAADERGRASCAAVGEADAARQELSRELELALAPDGPWTDAKSPVQGDARQGGKGCGAPCPRRGRGCRRPRSPPSSIWSSASSTRSERCPPARLVGRPASPGLARGPVVVLAAPAAHRARGRRPARGGGGLRAAIGGRDRGADRSSRPTAGEAGAEILGFQVAHARGRGALAPRPSRAIAAGAPADRGLARRRSTGRSPATRQPRTSISAPAPRDLEDIRDRVLDDLTGAGAPRRSRRARSSSPTT